MSELNQIFDTINLGLVITDRELRVRHWNRWMSRCSKIEPEVILGIQGRSRVPPAAGR
jgi:transcriptional regulator with PAS, ATPase and Fis domain